MEASAEARDGRRRVVIEGVHPEVDCGRFPIKRTLGERVAVEADVFSDGHDAVRAVVRHRQPGDEGWSETVMEPLVNDRFRATFAVERLGRAAYTVEAWVDHFASWQRDIGKKIEADQDVSVDLLGGADLVDAAASRAPAEDAAPLRAWARTLRAAANGGEPAAVALDEDAAALAARYPDRTLGVEYARRLEVQVDPERARFSSWYELFPRSFAPVEAEHGTLRDAERLLPYVAEMGFDVLYLPPIHPIGRVHRKGRNNAVGAAAGDIGSPWAIGAAEGGHTAVHPELGTADDVRHLVEAAQAHGIDVALDIAFQCAPDHPYVEEHPEWFRRRADGTIQYAENPPKKYQDIYPFDFESDDWRALWAELCDVVLHWCGHGVRIFRVDNPHTKPFAFWEWLIAQVKRLYPDAIFLAEAFTRPKLMYRLAKIGFTQGVTYFTWRTSAWELRQYFTELTATDVREYYRPNSWANTPDILPEHLQYGGRPAFAQRLLLAATLSATYGIYGPAFELCEPRAREPGSEEYLDSEKYQLRRWDLDAPHSLRGLIARVNRIRRDHPALQHDHTLRFHDVEGDALLCYSKRSPDGSDTILTVVNVDPHHAHAGWVNLDLGALGLEDDASYQVHDLLGDARYMWQGSRNFVQLDPHAIPAHVFAVRRRTRSEQDFDYFQ